MKYALIGCGRVAPNHIKAARENAFEIIAVCDIDDSHIDEMFENAAVPESESGKIRRYSDYNEMLETEKPELVSIALPSFLHAKAALSAIKKGINVIIEKPMAMSLEDADRIIEEARDRGVCVSACHQNRFNKAVQELRAALEAGRFGKLSHAAVSVRWSRDRSYYEQADWRGKWAADGGTLMNQCIHGIDLLRWMCADDIVRVYGVSKRQFHDYIEAEDVGFALIEFKNGAVASVEGSINLPDKNMEEHLTLIGEKGAVKLGGMNANTIEYWYFSDKPAEERDGFHERALNVYGNGHTSLFKDVADAVKNRRPPYVDAIAGKRALEAVLAIYKSSFTGEPVTLPLENTASADFEGFFDK